MKITFLGTGTSQGVPVIGCECEVCRSLDYRDKRLRSSIHIQTEEQSIVIDTGPDFRQQMLRERIRHLDAVLFTHAHKDHIAGLDDVRAYNYLQQTDMPLYGRKEALDQVKVEFYYAFEKDKYPGIPQLRIHEISEESFSVKGLLITPLPVMHMKLPVLGFRIGNFSYITDANFIPEATYEKLKGTEVFVLNALQKEKHPSHFTLEEALQQVKKIGAAKTYFTHISHKLGRHKIIEKELPESVALAYDGLTITL
ncbi:MAG: MBL fold metallo-hydrolase [Azospira oryzae]|nr:MBL fold metallo-hydrolase [Cytophaga sp.]PZR31515.1 MAG: MBL fold metallo-hydrolase [Azospira oryzae]